MDVLVQWNQISKIAALLVAPSPSWSARQVQRTWPTCKYVAVFLPESITRVCSSSYGAFYMHSRSLYTPSELASDFTNLTCNMLAGIWVHSWDLAWPNPIFQCWLRVFSATLSIINIIENCLSWIGSLQMIFNGVQDQMRWTCRLRPWQVCRKSLVAFMDVSEPSFRCLWRGLDTLSRLVWCLGNCACATCGLAKCDFLLKSHIWDL